VFKPFALMMISCCQSPDCPGLDEAYEFVSSYEMAKCICSTSEKHFNLKREEVENYWPEVWKNHWISLMNERVLLFELLTQVLNEDKSDEVRIQSLKTFKCLLGDEAYHARRLPPPFPTYK